MSTPTPMCMAGCGEPATSWLTLVDPRKVNRTLVLCGDCGTYAFDAASVRVYSNRRGGGAPPAADESERVDQTPRVPQGSGAAAREPSASRSHRSQDVFLRVRDLRSNYEKLITRGKARHDTSILADMIRDLSAIVTSLAREEYGL